MLELSTTSASRKRAKHRTAEQWQALIIQQAQSELSIKQFCLQQGITPSAFYNWRGVAVMLGPYTNTRFWLYTDSTDMRKSYDGLIALTKQQLQLNPTSGQAFIFINRRHAQLKCLYFDVGGYCLWCKRLEQGQFARYKAKDNNKHIELGSTELMALIEGRDMSIKNRRKRYK